MTTLHLFRETNSEDTYAAVNLDGAKALLVAAVGEDEAKECDDWEAIPDHKEITVRLEDGPETETKTAIEWANEESTPRCVFGANY